MRGLTPSIGGPHRLALIVGLGIVAVPTGLFASALSKAREGESERLYFLIRYVR